MESSSKHRTHPYHAASKYCAEVFVGSCITSESIRAQKAVRQAFVDGATWSDERMRKQVTYLKRRLAALVAVNRELQENQA